MARFVTVEGTATPCAGLPRLGQRVKFAVDDALRNLVKHGCIQVVEGSLDGPDDDDELFDEGGDLPQGTEVTNTTGEAEQVDGPPPGADDNEPVKEPAKNASRKAWAAFLRSRGVSFPDGDESKGEAWAGRDDLLIIWQQQHGS